MTSDIIILLDTNFNFRLPDKFFHPFIIEPVIKESRVRMPHRVTSKIMMNYLAPPLATTPKTPSFQDDASSLAEVFPVNLMYA